MDGENFIIDNIKSRRSIRSFKPQPIPKELQEKIVEAGRFAPSALNRQPWRFIVIGDNKLIEELSQIAAQHSNLPECEKALVRLVALSQFLLL